MEKGPEKMVSCIEGSGTTLPLPAAGYGRLVGKIHQIGNKAHPKDKNYFRGNMRRFG